MGRITDFGGRVARGALGRADYCVAVVGSGSVVGGGVLSFAGWGSGVGSIAAGSSATTAV